ncbi:hypothetical protein QRX50_30525 [Amycolatopsis carbonis]|uniref:Uncharacterized protein n=1 Tax=Amycolatopsis carbonis TaxID=715471 RepID=A0A9Y2MUE0_9PSEU|nr:hypothetical protein [Amycolatopsis sp. 2-15]WIX75804.1 hypothetical protein QRX50_30525 [Amycolatopsis sp. 2-15]
MTTGWIIGFSIGAAVVLVVVALVVPILVLARSIGEAAPLIHDELKAAERNTAPLAELRTTIDHAEVIVAGLRRGRERLGG